MDEEKEMSMSEACGHLKQFMRVFKKIEGSYEALSKAAGLESDVSSLQSEESVLTDSILKLKNEKMEVVEDFRTFEVDMVDRKKQKLNEFDASIELAQKVHDEKLTEIKTNEAADQLSYDEMMKGRQEDLRRIQSDVNVAQKELNAILEKKAAIERLVSEVKVSA